MLKQKIQAMYKTDISSKHDSHSGAQSNNQRKIQGLKLSFNSNHSNPKAYSNRSGEPHKRERSIDDIFKRIVPKEEYKNEPTCSICQMKFGMLSGLMKKYCQFCGRTVCSQHIKRSRKDPENIQEYAKICDACNHLYLQRHFSQKHKIFMSIRNKKFKQLQKEHSILEVEEKQLDKENK